jgi:hypothetical protein
MIQTCWRSKILLVLLIIKWVHKNCKSYFNRCLCIMLGHQWHWLDCNCNYIYQGSLTKLIPYVYDLWMYFSNILWKETLMVNIPPISTKRINIFLLKPQNTKKTTTYQWLRLVVAQSQVRVTFVLGDI